jgi:hypothetical protein
VTVLTEDTNASLYLGGMSTTSSRITIVSTPNLPAPAIILFPIPYLFTINVAGAGNVTLTWGVVTTITETMTTTHTTETVVYTPPDQATPQFWYFPILFIFGCGGMLFGLGMLLNADAETSMFLLFLGLTIGSLVGIMAGVVPLYVLILVAVMYTVRIWRS